MGFACSRRDYGIANQEKTHQAAIRKQFRGLFAAQNESIVTRRQRGFETDHLRVVLPEPLTHDDFLAERTALTG
jgi:hypothetical protein